MSKYFSADLTISIVDITADNKEQANDIIDKWITRIAPVMADKIRWDEADWTVEENVFNKEKEIWEVMQ